METTDTVRIPGFRVVRELGRGAMGVVYLAHEEALGREVALKVLRDGLAQDPAVRGRFDREARAAARLCHPNVVPVLSTGEAEGRLWYAMPYVAGRSLDRVLEESPGNRLPAARAVRIVRDLARTLAAAHRAGLTHRDVKPANVIPLAEPVEDLEKESATGRLRASWTGPPARSGPRADRPLLMDFGLASDRTADTRLSVSGVLIGTPAYMAPEQFEDRGEVGPAADQWALGVVLYECLTGRLPFPSADLPSLARLVTYEPPVAPGRLEPRVDRDLETILLECLEKDPRDRYADCDALADDLGRWLQEEPIAARPPGALRRLRSGARRHPVRATVLVLLVGSVLLGSALLAVREVEHARQIRSVAQEARTALAAGAYERAEDLYNAWIALDASAAQPRDERERARAGRQVQRALEFQGRAQQLAARLEAARTEVEALDERARRGARAEGGEGLGLEEARGSEPWWMREPAHRARVALTRVRAELSRLQAETAGWYDAALATVEAAAPQAGERGDRARREIRASAAAWHMAEWRWANARGDEEAGLRHRTAIERLDPAPYAEELEGEAEVLLLPGDVPAKAWLFRFVPESVAVARGGPRLLPLPFDHERRATRVPARYPEAVAQRLAGEGERPVQPDVPSVTEYFGSSEAHVGTMLGPMRRSRYEQLLRDTAYPLDTSGGGALGRLEEPMRLRLPPGPYLVLLRAAGRADVRLPFEIRRRQDLRLEPGRLPFTGEVPAGFVHVSAGPVVLGSEDPRALDAIAPREVEVDAFLAARFELTYAEYWEFLNDPLTLAEIDARLETSGGADLRYVPRVIREDGRALPLVERTEKGWWRGVENPELPLVNVSLYDLVGYLEPPKGSAEPADHQVQDLAHRLARSRTADGWGYLRWRTERSRLRARHGALSGTRPPDVAVVEGPDGRDRHRALRFALPTEREWMRMARGGDRRAFVYGDEREWLYFKGNRSRPTNPNPEPVGLFPEDESVFGVRDLAGSVAEWTADWTEVHGAFHVLGHSWDSLVAEDDRLGSRRALPPGRPTPSVGCRLVVRETEPARTAEEQGEGEHGKEAQGEEAAAPQRRGKASGKGAGR